MCHHTLKQPSSLAAVRHASVPTLRSAEAVKSFEFKANLVYTVSSRTAKVTQRNPVPKNKTELSDIWTTFLSSVGCGGRMCCPTKSFAPRMFTCPLLSMGNCEEIAAPPSRVYLYSCCNHIPSDLILGQEFLSLISVQHTPAVRPLFTVRLEPFPAEAQDATTLAWMLGFQIPIQGELQSFTSIQ